VRLGGVPVSKNMFWKQKRDHVKEQCLLEQSRVDKKHYGQYHEFKLSKIEDEDYLNLDSLQPDAERMLTLIRKRFQKVVMITLRRNNDSLDAQLSRMGLKKYFDIILSGFDEGSPGWKIKVDLFLNEMLGEDDSDMSGYFIGDTETDILAGKEIGLKTVTVLSGIRSRKILERYNPDCIIDRLSNFEALLRSNGKDHARL
jgi:phosphoglycolate phosphatase-like HAD superfamily hydrolase